MSTEENYLDNLLKAISEPKPGVPVEGESTGQNGDREAVTESSAGEPDAAASAAGEDLNIAEDTDGLELPDVTGDLELPDDTGDLDDIADILDAAGDLDLSDDTGDLDLSDMPDIIGDLDDTVNPAGGPDAAGSPDMAGAPDTQNTIEDLDMPDAAGDLNIPDTIEDLDIPDMAGELNIPDTIEDLDIPDMAGELSIPDTIEDLDIPDMAGELNIPDTIEDLNIADDLTIPDDTGDLPEAGEDTAVAENTDAPREISIDGLDAAIAEATELAMASELDIKELEVGDNDELKLEDIEIPDAAGDQAPEADKAISDELGIDAADLEIPDDMLADDGMELDDGLDEVLNMLDADSDSDLAEINNMLKKSDNNEPIQDDMMDLLNQMADNEAAFINAEDGVTQGQEGGSDSVDADIDGGSGQEPVQEDTPSGKKKASRKKGGGVENASQEEKKPGVFGKLFNALTEDLVPEPTEEELEAEKAAKEAKKKENLTKKEEEKAAKEEEKKAKAEEKEAAKKAKAEETEKKKKEKQAAKEAKRAAKKAKEEAAGPKPKRIPPKKFAIGAAFGISVGGAILVASSVLSTQGSLQMAKNAYYEGDYKTAYLATYGMELKDSDNQLIQKRSETISKLQRRYDAYETNLKMGREVEALNALLEGITTYDYINVDAEQYGVLSEVNAMKDNILNTLYTKYGLDEESARTLLQVPDSLTYTMALYAIVNGN